MNQRAAALCLLAAIIVSMPAPAAPGVPRPVPPVPASDPPATFRGLADLPGGQVLGAAFGISADGHTVVGQSATFLGREACYWVDGGTPVSLGPSPGGDFGAGIDAASDDGTVLVGSRQRAPGQYAAFRWTAAGGMVFLGDLPGASTTASPPTPPRTAR